LNLDTTIPLFKAFQALYLHLKSPQWRSAPFKRAKRDLLLATKEALKDLDQQTSKSMMDKITKGDVRFQDPDEREASSLDMIESRNAILEQLGTQNLELSVVGDFDPQELESLACSYLGTLPHTPAPLTFRDASEVPNGPASLVEKERYCRVKIQDSVERSLLLAGFRLEANHFRVLCRPGEVLLQTYREMKVIITIVDN